MVKIFLQITKINKNMSNQCLFYQLISIQYFTYNIVKNSIDGLRKGIQQVFNIDWLHIFQPQQLQVILEGVPFINLNDWKNNTIYKGQYYPNHKIIVKFWSILANLSQQKLRKFFQFCTGSQRPPLYGFKSLQSNRNTFARFCITSCKYTNNNTFPKAYTCFNRLELPVYPTQKHCEYYLLIIINNDTVGLYGLD